MMCFKYNNNKNMANVHGRPLTEQDRRRTLAFAGVSGVELDQDVFDLLWKLNGEDDPGFVTDLYGLYAALTQKYLDMLRINMNEEAFYSKACELLLIKIRDSGAAVGATSVVRSANELRAWIEAGQEWKELRARLTRLEADFAAFSTMLQFVRVH